MSKTKFQNQFSISEKRRLVHLLEKMQRADFEHYNFFKVTPPERKKTTLTVIDRRFRLRIKATEYVIHELKSSISSFHLYGTTRPNFRKTLTIKIG